MGPTDRLSAGQAARPYFTPARDGGKLFRSHPKTDVFTVATLQWADFIEKKRAGCGAEARFDAGRMTSGEALDLYRHRLEGNPHLQEGAEVCRRRCLVALLKSW